MSVDRRYGVVENQAIKNPCLVATTGTNIVLSGLQTIDGVVLTDSCRVLVKDQTDTTKNGVYLSHSAGWTRDLDFDGTLDIVRGTLVPVNSGSTNAGTLWQVTTADPIYIDGSAPSNITFSLSDPSSKAIINAPLKNPPVDADQVSIIDSVTNALARVTWANVKAAILLLFSVSGGSALVGFIQAGTGATARTGQTKLREFVSVLDFGADPTGVADSTAAIQAAINYAVSLQASGLGGGSGGLEVHFPKGVYKHTDLTLAPVSGIISVGLVGEGRSSGLNYTGTNGTAITISNNNNAYIKGLYLNNAGAGTNTGIIINSLTTGSSSTLMQPDNLLIVGFATGIQIGTTTDHAASEAYFKTIAITNCATGFLILDSTTVMNSLNLQFVDCSVSNGTTGFKYSAATNSENNMLTFIGCECNGMAVDFEIDSPAHINIISHHTEGNTASWKFLNIAGAAAASSPMFLNIENPNVQQSSPANSIIAWPGSYTFRNVGGIAGLTVGDAGNGNAYQIDIYGFDLAITNAGGALSQIFAVHWPACVNISNNQGIAQFKLETWSTTGVHSTIATIPWANASLPIWQWGSAVIHKRIVVTYSASMTFDASIGNIFFINVTNASAMTINNPLNPSDGQRITVTISNTSGGAMGIITWGTAFKMSAWTNPASANNRSIDFEYNGTAVLWYQVCQTGTDVPN